MNSKLFSISICALVAIHGSLFSMRQLTAKTGSKAAQSVAAMSGASRAFSARPWPTQNAINDAKSIALAKPLDQGQGNQQKSESGAGGQENPRAKWYQGKTFKYPAAGIALSAGVAGFDKYQKSISRDDKELVDSLTLPEKEKVDQLAEQEKENPIGEEQKETSISEEQKAAEEKEAKNNAKKEEKMLKKREETWAKTDDVATVDPELYQVVLRMKKDLGIMQDVPVRIEKPGSRILGDNSSAHFNPALDCIIIKNDYRKWSKSVLIATLRHELEHYCQSHGHIGSSDALKKQRVLIDKSESLQENLKGLTERAKKRQEHDPYGLHPSLVVRTKNLSPVYDGEREIGFKEFDEQMQLIYNTYDMYKDQLTKIDRMKAETGADAAAAGYFDCPDCLRSVADEPGQFPYGPHETDGHYFTTEKGYFSKEDYEPYIERAECEGAACKGHAFQRSAKKILNKFIEDQKKENPQNLRDKNGSDSVDKLGELEESLCEEFSKFTLADFLPEGLSEEK
ncbi:MAG: hypothetical protein NTU89_01560 [Candidatus Dependentiae bacterium]|nr:hypothetical protein [Candidatus Dependentiae bacterium]